MFVFLCVNNFACFSLFDLSLESPPASQGFAFSSNYTEISAAGERKKQWKSVRSGSVRIAREAQQGTGAFLLPLCPLESHHQMTG